MKKTCPHCKADLVERKNSKTGAPFWGCSKFPKCKYTKSFRLMIGDEYLYPDRPNDDMYPDDGRDDELFGLNDWIDPMDFGDN